MRSLIGPAGIGKGKNDRSYKSPLEELTKGKRGRSHPPWWKFAPPHGEQYRVTSLEGEQPAHSVDEVAAIRSHDIVGLAPREQGAGLPYAAGEPAATALDGRTD